MKYSCVTMVLHEIQFLQEKDEKTVSEVAEAWNG